MEVVVNKVVLVLRRVMKAKYNSLSINIITNTILVILGYVMIVLVIMLVVHK